MEKTRGFDWFSLIVGILSVIAGWMVIANPAGSFLGLAYLFGVFALAKGIYELWFRSQIKNTLGESSTALMILGIVDLLIGIYLILHIGVSATILPYLFSVWFILDSIFELYLAKYIKAFSKGYYWFVIVLNVICLILGIIMLFNPMIAAGTLVWLVGFYFVFFGIAFITEAF